jgi:uncharacterized membrane protein YphA (DoxX/SURF4 family)
MSPLEILNAVLGVAFLVFAFGPFPLSPSQKRTMKLTANIVAALLGLVFVVFGLNFFLHFIATPMPPEGSPAAAFIGAMYSTGYLKLVKILEVVGGVLLVLPRTRNLGLIVIGAIVFNIACIHQFMFGGIKDPVVIFSILSCAFLAYAACKGCCASSCSESECCGESASSGCCGDKK